MKAMGSIYWMVLEEEDVSMLSEDVWKNGNSCSSKKECSCNTKGTNVQRDYLTGIHDSVAHPLKRIVICTKFLRSLGEVS